MKTQNIIQTSVNVIKLVNLKKGDIFKSIKSDNYSNEITYNIVINLYNDGEKSYIEVIQYTKSYDSVNADYKIFEGTEDISIFPATIQEVNEYFDLVIVRIGEKIKEDKEALQKKIIACEKLKEFAKGELSKNIQEAEFKEQTQKEYQNEKELKEAKLKELTN